MEKHFNTKTRELLADNTAVWTVFNQLSNRTPEQQMTSSKDSQGWAAKDHIFHLAAWENSVVFFLEGKPRYEGLQIKKELYSTEVYDDINAAIFQQNKDKSILDAVLQLGQTHEKLLKIIDTLNDDDLQKTYQQYLPDERGNNRLVFEVIYSNTVAHFEEHKKYIEELIDKER